MSGFIKNKARSEIFTLKPYVPGKPIDEVKRELGLEDVIKLASNENPLGPSTLAIDAVKKSAEAIQLYPDANSFYLKQKLSSLFQIKTDGIVIGNGSDELLMMLGRTLLYPGDEVIYAQPTFAEYEFTARLMGAKCCEIPLCDFRHDMKAILAAVTDKTKIIYICNPNNPTGSIISENESDSFMQALPHDILVVFDEAYAEYAENSEFSSGLKYVEQGRNVIVLRTFSKIYGLAGLRAGYGLTTSEIAAALEMVSEPFNINLLAQAGALAALEDNEHVEKSRMLNSQGKQYLYREFQQMGLSFVETDANFIFVDTGKDCLQVFQELLKHGVIIRTGNIFGYPTYIRVTIGTMEQNARFIRELKSILEDWPG